MDEELLVRVCSTKMPAPAPSELRQCADCGQDVWLSHHGRNLMKDRYPEMDLRLARISKGRDPSRVMLEMLLGSPLRWEYEKQKAIADELVRGIK
jgi:hypothetical protein